MMTLVFEGVPETADMQHLGVTLHDAAGCADVERRASANLKRTWVSGARGRDWSRPGQGRGPEFLRQASQVKNIWVPYGV